MEARPELMHRRRSFNLGLFMFQKWKKKGGKTMDVKKLAGQILKEVGGKENIKEGM